MKYEEILKLLPIVLDGEYCLNFQLKGYLDLSTKKYIFNYIMVYNNVDAFMRGTLTGNWGSFHIDKGKSDEEMQEEIDKKLGKQFRMFVLGIQSKGYLKELDAETFRND